MSKQWKLWDGPTSQLLRHASLLTWRSCGAEDLMRLGLGLIGMTLRLLHTSKQAYDAGRGCLKGLP